MPKAKPIDKPERTEYFIARTHLVNDATQSEYQAGETVTSRDFEPDVIADWLTDWRAGQEGIANDSREK